MTQRLARIVAGLVCVGGRGAGTEVRQMCRMSAYLGIYEGMGLERLESYLRSAGAARSEV